MLTTFNIKERNKNPVSHNSPLFLTPPCNSVPTPCWNLDWLDLAWAATVASSGPVTSQRNCFTSQSLDSYRPSVPLPNGPWALAREAWHWYPFVTGHSKLTSSSQTNSLVRSGSCTSLWAQRYEFRGWCDVYWLNNSCGFPFLGLMSFSSHDLGQIYNTRLMFPPLEQVLNPARDWSTNPLALL